MKDVNKNFSCPYCGQRISIWKLYTLKSTLCCVCCGKSFKPKKQVVSFQMGFFLSSGSITSCGLILKYFGVSFAKNMLICLGIGIVIMLIVNAITYFKTEFE